MSGDVDTVTLDPTSVLLEADTYDDVTLTIPRAALSDAQRIVLSSQRLPKMIPR